jgi:chromosome segregation ATPase
MDKGIMTSTGRLWGARGPIPIHRPSPAGCAILSEDAVSFVVMATTEDRIRDLEVRVDQLETWAGPGQAGALAEGLRELRAEFTKMRATQDRHTRMLADITADLSGLKTDFDGLKTEVDGLKTDVATLKTDVATLKTDVATLKTDVATLKTDVATLKTDVATLKTDVAELKADMAEVKVTLQEILRRLPAPASDN